MTKIEYVYLNSPSAGAPDEAGGSAAKGTVHGEQDSSGAPGDGVEAASGSSTHGTSAGGGKAHGSGSGGTANDPAHGGSASGDEQGGSELGGSPHGGSSHGGAAHASAGRGGSGQGGSARGGSETGGSMHAGSAGTALVAGAGAGGSAPAVCPQDPPAVGESCPTEGRMCTWGDSGLPECRTFLVCTQGQWVNGTLPGVVGAEGDVGRVCHEPAPGACPNVSPAGTDCSAALDHTRCQYDNGTLCACLVNYCTDGNCAPLPSPEWVCNQILPPCPGKVPNAGSPCSGPDGSCTYDYSSLSAQCIDGVWEWQLYSPT